MRWYLSKDLKKIRESIKNIRKTRNYSCIHPYRMWNMTESFCEMFYITIKENEIGQCPQLDAQGRDWGKNECTGVLLGRALRSKPCKDSEGLGKQNWALELPWWLLPMQETRVRSLIWEDPTCHGATKPVRHNRWACAPEPASHSYWACVPQSPCSATREATTMRSLSTATREQVPLAATREKPLQQQRPSTTKNNK